MNEGLATALIAIVAMVAVLGLALAIARPSAPLRLAGLAVTRGEQ